MQCERAVHASRSLEYSYYPGMDNLHAVKKGSTIYYAHVDLQGNVIALTTGTTVSRTYLYSAWGGNIGGTDPAGFAGTDRARWKGALFFGEFNGLYYMRARWYDPIQGRFLSEDPIGLAGGINPCVFAGNDPINGRDPTGLDPDPYQLPPIIVTGEGEPWWERIKGWLAGFGSRSFRSRYSGSGGPGSESGFFGGGGGGAGSLAGAAREERAACYENNRFSALFPEGAARNTVELVEMGSAISLAGDLVATFLKATRGGVGGTTTAYASGFNMLGRNVVQAGGNFLRMSPDAIGRGVGMVNSVGNRLTPTMAVIGAFTLAYNTTIQVQCRIGAIN